MEVLTRQQMIEQLQAAEQGILDGPDLSRWAFDQFYAEEAGDIAYESGYRHAMLSVLDDLMFSDQPGFHVGEDELRQMIEHLADVQPADDEDDDDEDDE